MCKGGRGGVQMLICIETHITCDFLGGMDPLSPPTLDPHMHIQFLIEILPNFDRKNPTELLASAIL